MFVNQVLFHYEKVCYCFYLTFWDARIMFITLLSENSQNCHKTVNFWTVNATKIIKIWLLSEMLTSANIFAKFHCFDKK